MPKRFVILVLAVACVYSLADPRVNAQEKKRMNFIYAHVHVWTPDTARYFSSTIHL